MKSLTQPQKWTLGIFAIALLSRIGAFFEFPMSSLESLYWQIWVLSYEQTMPQHLDILFSASPLLAGIYSLLGTAIEPDFFWFRLLPFLFGMASLWPLHQILGRAVSSSWRYRILLLVSLSPILVYYSTVHEPYVFALWLFLVCVNAYEKNEDVLSTPLKPRKWFGRLFRWLWTPLTIGIGLVGVVAIEPFSGTLVLFFWLFMTAQHAYRRHWRLLVADGLILFWGLLAFGALLSVLARTYRAAWSTLWVRFQNLSLYETFWEGAFFWPLPQEWPVWLGVVAGLWVLLPFVAKTENWEDLHFQKKWAAWWVLVPGSLYIFQYMTGVSVVAAPAFYLGMIPFFLISLFFAIQRWALWFRMVYAVPYLLASLAVALPVSWTPIHQERVEQSMFFERLKQELQPTDVVLVQHYSYQSYVRSQLGPDATIYVIGSQSEIMTDRIPIPTESRPILIQSTLTPLGTDFAEIVLGYLENAYPIDQTFECPPVRFQQGCEQVVIFEAFPFKQKQQETQKLLQALPNQSG